MRFQTVRSNTLLCKVLLLVLQLEMRLNMFVNKLGILFEQKYNYFILYSFYYYSTPANTQKYVFERRTKFFSTR